MGSPNQLPQERTILKPFILPDEQGRKVNLESFRQQRNLVLVVLNRITPHVEALLGQFAASQEALIAEEGMVLVVVHGGVSEAELLRRRLSFPFPVLADETGEVVESLCADDCSVYVADRFREVFAARHAPPLLSCDEILEWLAHINRQCPE